MHRNKLVVKNLNLLGQQATPGHLVQASRVGSVPKVGHLQATDSLMAWQLA